MEQLTLSQKAKKNLTDKEKMEVRLILLNAFNVKMENYDFRSCEVILLRKLITSGIEKVIGFALVNKHQEILFIYVKLEHRKKGYGKLIISYLKVQNKALSLSTTDVVLQKILIDCNFKTKDNLTFYYNENFKQ